MSCLNNKGATLSLKPPGSNDLIQDIFVLSKEIDEKKYKLKTLLSKFFMNKVKLFISFDLTNDESSFYKTIQLFHFSPNRNGWKCHYIHETSSYSLNNYCIDSDSEDIVDLEDTTSEDVIEVKDVDVIDVIEVKDDMPKPYYKKTKISFGYKNGKYYLDCKNGDIKVFTSNNLPKLYSLSYEYAANVDQYDVMNQYTRDKNIPEWLAIRFFLQVYRHKYYVEKINKYFTIT